MHVTDSIYKGLNMEVVVAAFNFQVHHLHMQLNHLDTIWTSLIFFFNVLKTILVKEQVYTNQIWDIYLIIFLYLFLLEILFIIKKISDENQGSRWVLISWYDYYQANSYKNKEVKQKGTQERIQYQDKYTAT